MHRTPLAVAGLAFLALLVMAPTAAALDRHTGWDGTNPFTCELQQAGDGATVSDPAADPYCVEYDKTRQNVTELGLVDFLSQEPARLAAAVPKCRYFQVDHWRSSVVQSDGSTTIYEWTGHYFFDKGRAEGGAWVTGFAVAGQSGDPSLLPGLPPDLAAPMGPGTGGVRTSDDVPAYPSCA
jgi:hypothetical protein